MIEKISIMERHWQKNPYDQGKPENKLPGDIVFYSLVSGVVLLVFIFVLAIATTLF